MVTLLCGASKRFMKALKVEELQSSVKIKIYVNYHFDATFWNARGEKC